MVANGSHGADDVVPEHERELRLSRIQTAAHALLAERHSGGEHLHNGLAAAGSRDRSVLYEYAVGFDEAGQDDLSKSVVAGHG